MRLFLQALTTAALCACASAGPPVKDDSRDGFDTVKGLYGGNEFTALAPEGKREFQGDPAPSNTDSRNQPAKAQTVASAPPSAPTQAPAPAPASVAPTPAPVAPAPAAAPQLAMASPPPSRQISIDPNAFAAVFGSASGPVKPSAEQLMQLDSISLMASDAKRMNLQQQILACRRAADACRLTNQ